MREREGGGVREEILISTDRVCNLFKKSKLLRHYCRFSNNFLPIIFYVALHYNELIGIKLKHQIFMCFCDQTIIFE